MGVHGLYSFIAEHPEYLQDYQLHDTKLIIDGSNLIYYIAHTTKPGIRYGGNYDTYYEEVKRCFVYLRECNVSLYVVFDGAYTKDDKKVQTILQRLENRIRLSSSISEGGRGTVCPLLCRETFTAVLNQLGVPHVTCDFEADEQIVSLANEWGCPVLSKDSDFFIFHIQGGYVMLDLLEFFVTSAINATTQENYKYLPSKIYYADKFVESFPGVQTTMLPILATVSGTDFIKSMTLSAWVDKLKSAPSQRFSKLYKILHWLSCKGSYSSALSELTTNVCADNEELKLKVLESVHGYSNLPDASELKNYFQSRPSTQCLLETYDHEVLPDRFVSAFRQGRLSPFLINALTLHDVKLLCQVENFKDPSADLCSLTLRLRSYQIMLTKKALAEKLTDDKDADENKSTAESASECTFIEFGRLGKNIKKYYIKVHCSPDLPSMFDVPSMSPEERLHVLYDVLYGTNVVQDSRLCPRYQLIFGSIVYWITNAKPPVSIHHVQSVLVCIIYLCVCRMTSQEQETTDNHSTDESARTPQLSIMSCTTTELSTVQRVEANLHKYSADPKVTKKAKHRTPDITLIHGFSQLQTCVLFASNLNQLLLCPVDLPNPADFFNGTFLHNFCRDLMKRTNVDKFIAEMLVKGSPVAQLYTEMYDFVTSFMDLTSFSVPRAKTAKRKAKAPKPEITPADQDTLAYLGDCVDRDSDEFQVDYEVNCDVDNRFSLLNIASS